MWAGWVRWLNAAAQMRKMMATCSQAGERQELVSKRCEQPLQHASGCKVTCRPAGSAFHSSRQQQRTIMKETVVMRRLPQGFMSTDRAAK